MLAQVQDFYLLVVVGILVLFAVLETLTGLYRRTRRSKDDWLVEFVSFIQLSALVKPGIVLLVSMLGHALLPERAALAWSGAPLWWALPFYLLVDDLLQYWYHRQAHSWEWLWKLHRPHHAAREMGVLVAYRNAALYYVFMPNIWWVGLMTFLGFGQAVAVGLIVKQLVIIGAHSDFRWDRFLYVRRWLHPVAWVVERTISTPATHFSHHGTSAEDGVSNPNGNFGNLFFFWDLLFGTAIITRRYPERFGLVDDPRDGWAAHLYYPFVKSSKEGSEIGGRP